MNDERPEYPITNHVVFKAVFSIPEIAHEFLKIALGEEFPEIDLGNLTIEPEETIEPAADKRSVRLDVGMTTRNTRIDLELQKYKDDLARRSRYSAALMDMKHTKPGAAYDELSNVLVIFLMTKDLYHQRTERLVSEKRLCKSRHGEDVTEATGYEEGYATILLNAGAANDRKPGTPLSNLLEYFRTGKPVDKFTRKIHEAVLEVNRREHMSMMTVGDVAHLEAKKIVKRAETRGIRKGIAQGITQGLSLGKEEKTSEMIIGMYDNGIPMDKIMKISGLSEASIKKILKN